MMEVADPQTLQLYAFVRQVEKCIQNLVVKTIVFVGQEFPLIVSYRYVEEFGRKYCNFITEHVKIFLNIFPFFFAKFVSFAHNVTNVDDGVA